MPTPPINCRPGMRIDLQQRQLGHRDIHSNLRYMSMDGLYFAKSHEGWCDVHWIFKALALIRSNRWGWVMTESLTLQALINAYPPSLDHQPLSLQKRKICDHIQACRTPVMGGVQRTCDHCGYSAAQYHACRDRIDIARNVSSANKHTGAIASRLNYCP